MNHFCVPKDRQILICQHSFFRGTIESSKIRGHGTGLGSAWSCYTSYNVYLVGNSAYFWMFFQTKYYLGLTYCIVILATTGIIFETWWERWRLHSVLYYQHITMYAFFNIFGLSRYFVTKISVLNGKSFCQLKSRASRMTSK